MPDVPSKIVRLRVVVSGRVQGVSFRTSLREIAARFHVCGWVRNRSDGSVEAILQGEEESVLSVLAWARHGPAGALVADLRAERESPSNDLHEFRICR